MYDVTIACITGCDGLEQGSEVLAHRHSPGLAVAGTSGIDAAMHAFDGQGSGYIRGRLLAAGRCVVTMMSADW